MALQSSKIALVLTALVAVSGFARGAQATPSSCSAEYWVAADGDDRAPGDASRPFRTLERARDVVREDTRRGRCEIAVNIRGEHRLAQPLTLDSKDSGAPGSDVVYRAAPGAQAVLSGAVHVGNWALHDPMQNIWRAYAGPYRTRQLYVNGMRAVRARTAPYPAEYAINATGYRYVQPGGMPPKWAQAGAVEAVTVTQWKMMRCPVAAQAGADVVMQQPCWTNANVFHGAPGEAPLWNFQLLSRFENAYEFLDEPGEWYFDEASGWLYYIPRPGEDMATAQVELPVLEALIDGHGKVDTPVTNLRFEGLTFAYATWLEPSGPSGYAADQSGFHLVGGGHQPNIIGHDPNVARTPGNVRFIFARNITLAGNRFVHLGAVGLDFDTGSQDNQIVDNTFEDISSAAIQVGGVTSVDHHPEVPSQLTRDNRIANNLVQFTGRDYLDAAGIYIGVTTRTTVEHNDILDVPWAGIAIGWGWGLYDPGSFPGLPHASSGEWGLWETPTAAHGNRIVHNRIERFLLELWDGGAIYSQGAQGTSLEDGQLIAWNVASGKRTEAGGNIFYTDGGSRYITLLENASFDNPLGITDFGPCGLPSSLYLCGLHLPYGFDTGGCVTYGNILFAGNFWISPLFYDVCPYKDYPIDMAWVDNQWIKGKSDVPAWLLDSAGRQPSAARRP